MQRQLLAPAEAALRVTNTAFGIRLFWMPAGWEMLNVKMELFAILFTTLGGARASMSTQLKNLQQATQGLQRMQGLHAVLGFIMFYHVLSTQTAPSTSSTVLVCQQTCNICGVINVLTVHLLFILSWMLFTCVASKALKWSIQFFEVFHRRDSGSLRRYRIRPHLCDHLEPCSFGGVHTAIVRFVSLCL